MSVDPDSFTVLRVEGCCNAAQKACHPYQHEQVLLGDTYIFTARRVEGLQYTPLEGCLPAAAGKEAEE
jgi:hypothetical protein